MLGSCAFDAFDVSVYGICKYVVYVAYAADIAYDRYSMFNLDDQYLSSLDGTGCDAMGGDGVEWSSDLRQTDRQT